MTTGRIDLSVSSSPTPTVTAPRATDPSTREAFRGAMASAGSTLLGVMERSLPFAPGGVGMTAALRAAPGAATSASTVTTGGIGTELPASGALGAGLVQDSQDQALHLLALQQQLGNEQRQFTTFSNVMKARNDTVKNVIGNVR